MVNSRWVRNSSLVGLSTASRRLRHAFILSPWSRKRWNNVHLRPCRYFRILCDPNMRHHRMCIECGHNDERVNGQGSLGLNNGACDILGCDRACTMFHILGAKLQNVSAAIVNSSLCSGTWEIATESFQLCFRKGDDPTEYVQNPFTLHLPYSITSDSDGSTCQRQLRHSSNLLLMYALQLFGANNKSWIYLIAKLAKWMSMTLWCASILSVQGMRTELYKYTRLLNVQVAHNDDLTLILSFCTINNVVPMVERSKSVSPLPKAKTFRTVQYIDVVFVVLPPTMVSRSMAATSLCLPAER